MHSLPELQRYATTQAEWAMLLNRQNYLLTDLLGNNEEVVLVTGEYEFDNITLPADDTLIGELIDLNFTPSERLDLHQLSAESLYFS